MLVVSILAAVLALIVLLGTTGTWEAGKNTKVMFLVSGGSNTALQVTDHSWAEMIDAIDITHTGSGGVQALLAGILRGDGNVKANFDSAAKYYSTAPGVNAGASGVFQLFMNGTLYYSVPAMIKKVNTAKPVAGAVSYDFDISMNSEAGAYAKPA